MSSKEVVSPITGSSNVESLKSLPYSITSYSELTDLPVDNFICKDSGLIFNATGTRGKEDEFYCDMYDLHSENVESEFKYETSSGLLGIYDNIVQFIGKSVKLPESGNMLDIGCGKGLLLKKFSQKWPEWKQFAIEPSKNAIPYFNQVMPELKVFNGKFEHAPFLNQRFDLVTANGVLEHVPNPVAFMQLFRDCLSEDGIGFIGVPNFSTNPIDVFTYDHLSRFVPETIQIVFQIAGLEVIKQEVSSARVPMWFLVKRKKTHDSSTYNSKYESQLSLFNSNWEAVNSTFENFNKCKSNLSSGEKVIVYGTGAVGLIATKYTALCFDDIECFVEDNNSLWGTRKYQIPVESPAVLKQKASIKHILISANPCYHSKIIDKLKKLKLDNQKVYS